MSDVIQIVGLRVPVFIGVPDEERATAQEVKISVDLEVASVAPAARKDAMSLSIDYYVVSQFMHNLCAARPRKLIETLAEELAVALLREYGSLERVTVEVRKFILPDADYVTVRLTRTR
jgi:7,8-dihydroneopterin aldolase/epimerase/oxygenase